MPAPAAPGPGVDGPARPARNYRRNAAAAVVLALVAVAAVVVAAGTDATRLGGPRVDPDRLPVGPPAPGLDGATGWVGSPPLVDADLAGRVVVYDFWTYSCVNCVRTLPYLRAWHDRYGPDGLVIVGVHSPEFGFERRRENVEAAVSRLGVGWPVAMDNSRAVWHDFANRFWPTKYVADRQGRLRYTAIGEGRYDETEDVLRSLLGVDRASPRAVVAAGAPAAGEPGEAARLDVTAETYLGLRRGSTGARPGTATYPEPARLAVGEAALSGPWTGEDERVTAAGPGAAVVLRYRAGEVNLVMTAPDAVEVVVELDGRPLPLARRGPDVAEDGERTVVRVDHDGMYRLVAPGQVGEHTLRLTVDSPGLSAYAFTFGT